MADKFSSRELLYNDEATFLANATAVASNTYANRIPFLEATVTLEQPRETDMTVQARKNQSRPGYLGLRTARVEFTCHVPGLITDPGAGTPTENWFMDLLSDGIGVSASNLFVTDDGGTVSSATDADTFLTSGITALFSGGIVRVGVKGDGRGDGQPGVVSSLAAGTVQLLTALPAAPTASDALRPTAYTCATEANPTITKRFLVSHKTTGAQYHIMGCQLDSVSFQFDIVSGLPVKATFSYLGAYWDSSTVTFPSSVALPNCDASPLAGGSMFFNTTGTATRATETPSSMGLSLRMGLLPVMGPSSGQPNYCNIYGWESTGLIPTLTMTVPWSSTKVTEFDLDGSSSTFKHCLFASNAQVGRAFGFYMPRMFPVGSRPWVTEANGLVYMTVSYQGGEGTDTASELSRSAVRFWQG